MGRYIQGPNHGKAEFIVSEYDGKISAQVEPGWGDKPSDMEWVLVVNNGPFEAAAWLFDEGEFDDFRANEIERRPRTYLTVPIKQIRELFPKYFSQSKVAGEDEHKQLLRAKE